MRNQVLQFLRNLPSKKEDQFNQAFLFLQKAPGVQFAQVRSYNVLGATPSNINNILYDLKKLYSITEVEIRSKKTRLQEVVDKKIEVLKSEIQKIDEEILNLNREESNEKNSLHDIFPFLKDKDCPNELLIVSGQVVASWKRYQDLKQQVDQITSGELEVTEEEDLRITAECEAEFRNNQSLYKELEHYKENNTILGEHEVLKNYAIAQKVKKMSVAELVQEQKNAASYLTKQRKELEKENLTEERKELIENRIAERELLLKHVNLQLNLS